MSGDNSYPKPSLDNRLALAIGLSYFIFLLIVLVNWGGVYAQPPGEDTVYLSFDDLNLQNQELSLYLVGESGSIYLQEVSNETLTLQAGNSYLIRMKPAKTDLLNNPTIAVDWFMAYLPLLFSIIFLLVIGLGLKKLIGRVS